MTIFVVSTEEVFATVSYEEISNMTTDDDLEANEESVLLEDDKQSPQSSDSPDAGIWQEMDQPWPATFERSISLLASPVINPLEADRFTKSPKPGNTPLAARRRMVRWFEKAYDLEKS